MESNARQVFLKGQVNLLYIQCPLSPVPEQISFHSDSFQLKSNQKKDDDIEEQLNFSFQAHESAINQQQDINLLESFNDISRFTCKEIRILDQSNIAKIISVYFALERVIYSNAQKQSQICIGILFSKLQQYRITKSAVHKLSNQLSKIMNQNLKEFFTLNVLKPKTKILKIIKQKPLVATNFDFRRVRRLFSELMVEGGMVTKLSKIWIHKLQSQEQSLHILRRLLSSKLRETYISANQQLILHCINVVKLEGLSKVIKNIPKSSQGMIFKSYCVIQKTAREQMLVQESMQESDADLSMISMTSSSYQPPSNFKSKLRSLKNIFLKRTQTKISNKNIHKYLGIEHGLFSLFRIMESSILHNLMRTLERLKTVVQRKVFFITAMRNLMNLRHSKEQQKQLKFFYRWKSIVHNDVSQLFCKVSNIMKNKRKDFYRQFIFALTQKCLQIMIHQQETQKKENQRQQIITRDKTSKQISSFFQLERSLRRARKNKIQSWFNLIQDHVEYKQNKLAKSLEGMELIGQIFMRNNIKHYYQKVQSIKRADDNVAYLVQVLFAWFNKSQDKLVLISFHKILLSQRNIKRDKLKKFSLQLIFNKLKKIYQTSCFKALQKITNHRLQQCQAIEQFFQIIIGKQRAIQQQVINHMSHLLSMQVPLLDLQKYLSQRNTLKVLQTFQLNSQAQKQKIKVIKRTLNIKQRKINKILQINLTYWRQVNVNERYKDLLHIQTKMMMLHAKKQDSLLRIITKYNLNFKKMGLDGWKYCVKRQVQIELRQYEKGSAFICIIKLILKRAIRSQLNIGFLSMKSKINTKEFSLFLNRCAHKYDQQVKTNLKNSFTQIFIESEKRRQQILNISEKINTLNILCCQGQTYKIRACLKIFHERKFRVLQQRQRYELAQFKMSKIISQLKQKSNNIFLLAAKSDQLVFKRKINSSYKQGLKAIQLIFMDNSKVCKSSGFTKIKFNAQKNKIFRLKTLKLKQISRKQDIKTCFGFWRDFLISSKEEFQLSVNIQNLRTQIFRQTELLTSRDTSHNYTPFAPLKIEHCIQTTQSLQTKRFRHIGLSQPLNIGVGNHLKSQSNYAQIMSNPIPLVPLEHEVYVEQNHHNRLMQINKSNFKKQGLISLEIRLDSNSSFHTSNHLQSISNASGIPSNLFKKPITQTSQKSTSKSFTSLNQAHNVTPIHKSNKEGTADLSPFTNVEYFPVRPYVSKYETNKENPPPRQLQSYMLEQSKTQSFMMEQSKSLKSLNFQFDSQRQSNQNSSHSHKQINTAQKLPQVQLKYIEQPLLFKKK